MILKALQVASRTQPWFI